MTPDIHPDQVLNVEPGPNGQPPLMVVYPRLLSATAIARLREAFERCYRGDGPFVLEETSKVYQCIDGRWEPLP